MSVTENRMYENIEKLFGEDLKLLERGVPSDGLWAVCEVTNTDYHGAIRILPTEFGSQEYALHVDVFETIYDPVFSNVLVKGSLSDMKKWLNEKSHVEDVYNCMHHLYALALDE